MAADQDTTDVVLQQAQMVCFAIPGVGAELAAAVSIADALYDAFGKPKEVPTYSVARAITDVGDQVIKGVQGMFDAAAFAKVTALTTEAEFWDSATRDYDTDGTPGAASECVAKVETDLKVNELAAYLSPDPVKDGSTTARNVQLIPEYFALINNYVQWVIAGLSYAARAAGLPPSASAPHPDHPDWPDEVTQAWGEIRSPARTFIEQAVSDAIDYLTPIVDHLDDVSTNLVAKANAAPSVVNAAPGAARTAAFTAEVRRLRAEAHLDVVTADQIATHVTTLGIFAKMLAGLKALAAGTLDPHPGDAPVNPKDPTNPPAPGSVPLPASRPLGARGPKTARFLFESKPGGGWVNIVGDSAVCSGYIATQNAGSTNAGLYYRVDPGAGGLNKQFGVQLQAAGILQSVNMDLQTAYNKVRGSGSYAKDSATPPSPPPTLSLIVGLDQQGPIGQHVVAMVYSVGPVLASGVITDTAGYTKIFTDAFDAIAGWNASYPQAQIAGFRVALLSTGIYGTPDPTLRAQAAGLIVDATVASLKAHPELAGLVVLVNTNDTATACGDERVAFTTAGTAHGVTPGLEGFDIPWT